MQQLLLSLRKSCWLLLSGGLIAFMFSYCSDEQLTVEPEPAEVQLKSFHGLPDYEAGQWLMYRDIVNNDSIEIIIPPVWNGQFIVYAHGYVDPNLPIHLPNDVIAGVPLQQLITSSGFAYASTSYSENGFAIKEGSRDVFFLGKQIKAHFNPDLIYLGGVSEGGLVAMKILERKQNVFDAGLVSCAPIGSFIKQLKYLGDFHVLFNYLYAEELANFPGGPINLGSPKGVPPMTMEAWSNGQLDVPLIWVISQEKWKLPLLFRLAKVPAEYAPNEEYLLLILKEMLRFNIMATNDMIERTRGIPFNNTRTWYKSDIPFDYKHLNTHIQRIRGDKRAYYHVIKLFESRGNPKVPIVLLHNTGDHITPYWHFKMMMVKLKRHRNLAVSPMPIDRYGHCNYTLEEVMIAIHLMTNSVN